MRTKLSLTALLGFGLIIGYHYWISSNPVEEPTVDKISVSPSKMVRDTSSHTVGLAAPIARAPGGVSKGESSGGTLSLTPVDISDSVKRPVINDGFTSLSKGDFNSARESFISVLFAERDNLVALRGLEAASRRQSSIGPVGDPREVPAIWENVAHDLEQEAAAAFQAGDLDSAIRSAQIIVTLASSAGSKRYQSAARLMEEALELQAGANVPFVSSFQGH